jgi:glycosyltransferase involved in cell wall biosynthesis
LEISVVIPTRNRAPKLRRTLEGLCAQSAPANTFEVVIVDNGSTDNTCEAVKDFTSRAANSPWSYLREAKPGAAAARNAGVQASRGDIVLFLDDDVVPDPQLIEEHTKSHREQTVIVLGAVRFPWDDSRTAFHRTLSEHAELLQSFRFPDPHNVPFQHFYTCNLSLPRDVLSRNGGFDESFRASGFEDIDLGYRLSKAGIRMVFNPRASGLHDCWQPFPEFAEKQRRNGRELRILLKKHPELRELFLPEASFARRGLLALAGGAASLLAPWFERPVVGFFSPLVLTALARLCWVNLQLRFRAGFDEAQ